MKYFAAYWLLGCLIVGLAWGGIIKDCPSRRQMIYNPFVLVATWPAVLVAALYSIDVDHQRGACE